MALLTSHLPFLYCMLYYRSDRPNYRDHVNRLLDIIQNSDDQAVRFNTSLKNPSDLADSSERFRTSERIGHHLRNKPWAWHDRNFDLDKICNRSDSQRQRWAQRWFGHSPRQRKNYDCFTKEPQDVRHMLPNRFLTVEELMKTLPRKRPSEPKLQQQQQQRQQQRRMKTIRRYTLNTGDSQDLKFSNHAHCSACNTEIGYEVLSEVTDLQGQNHTVLNFQNAYQFIAAGRCMNENSPCGGGGQARCSQIYRAHWTLVWAPGTGTQLVAHEVPSHCECINVGSAPLSTQEPVKNLKWSPPT